MKYRRYYQRVLKDRLTALRKVRHEQVAQKVNAHTIQNPISPQTPCVLLVSRWKTFVLSYIHRDRVEGIWTPETRAVTRFILNGD